jgi:hypothetical protein
MLKESNKLYLTQIIVMQKKMGYVEIFMYVDFDTFKFDDASWNRL